MISLDVVEQGWNLSSDELSWNKIKHFSKKEFSGHSGSLSSAIILALAQYRSSLKKRVIISPATWGKHSSKSWHYALEGRNDYVQAIDVFPAVDLAYAWMIAIKIGLFKGIGVYPYWSYPSKKLVGGLHLDTRKSNHTVLWWCDKNKNYHYFTNWKQVHNLFTLLLNHQ